MCGDGGARLLRKAPATLEGGRQVLSDSARAAREPHPAFQREFLIQSKFLCCVSRVLKQLTEDLLIDGRTEACVCFSAVRHPEGIFGRVGRSCDKPAMRWFFDQHRQIAFRSAPQDRINPFQIRSVAGEKPMLP